jgi:primosomal protein N' (replication factor Y) (superfamily II helicase)
LIVEVIFPLALPKPYTYAVSTDLQSVIAIGKRVEVPLKNKLYAGLIISVSPSSDLGLKLKSIISVLDIEPVVSAIQIQFWTWMAQYYCCTLGEVMNAAMPSSLKLESETKIVAHPSFAEMDFSLSDDEYLVAEAVSIQNELTLLQIQDILNRKTIFPIIRSLLDKDIISIKEELIYKFKPKTRTVLALHADHVDDPNLTLAFDLTKRSEAQTRAILAYAQMYKTSEDKVAMADLATKAAVDRSILHAMVKKNIFVASDEPVSRIKLHPIKNIDELPPLSEAQSTALSIIHDYHRESRPVLLHGVTGSGKTRLYAELIHKTIAEGRQVLLLLPEIALTSHLVQRLQAHMVETILQYHSRMNNNQRVEVWTAAATGAKVIVSARSGLFLPFQDLGLIIIDEEHDPSYKQQDPNPRYNARDAAFVLAQKYKAQILLGSATPSIETYHNMYLEKIGIAKLTERHGDAILPQISLIDLRKEQRDKRFDGLLSQSLREAIAQVLERGEQIILFQNRRGYAPTLTCHTCGWNADCPNCDVRLTLHKGIHMLKCHYCGTRQKKSVTCPACGSTELREQGFGTERIEEHIAEVFPQAKVSRLDMDTAKTKAIFDRILEDFENKDIDILVGTQMIAKGLDFQNISLVGVIYADGMLRYPDFRAGERAFQLLTQVAGRAGRRSTPGRVIIQSYNPDHPVLHETMHHLYESFYQRETAERSMFVYPPHYRLIEIQFWHKSAEIALHTANTFAHLLRPKLGNRIIGPSEPSIGRIRGQYIQTILIKHEKDAKITRDIKQYITDTKLHLKTVSATKSTRVIIDVDPY